MPRFKKCIWNAAEYCWGGRLQSIKWPAQLPHNPFFLGFSSYLVYIWGGLLRGACFRLYPTDRYKSCEGAVPAEAVALDIWRPPVYTGHRGYFAVTAIVVPTFFLPNLFCPVFRLWEYHYV